MTKPEVDVAIIGGGPAGVSAALGILAVCPDLRVKVYEQAERAHAVGAAVTLAKNGLLALRAIHQAAYSQLMASSTKLSGLTNYNADGSVMSQMDVSSAGEHSPTAITWFELHKLLCDNLPEGVLSYGYKFEGVESYDDDGAVLLFEGHPSVHAKVAIGADGNMSAVRKAVLQEPRPDYSGVAVWRCMSDIPHSWQQPHGSVASWAVDGTLVAIRTMEDRLTVTALSAWPEERLSELYRLRYYGPDAVAGADVSQKLERLLPLISKFPPHIVDMVKSVDPSTILEHGMYNRNPGKAWGAHSVTMVGDAAHVLPPNLGQGTSMAFEDAYHLAASIGEHGPSSTALRHYEDIRVDRVSQVWEASQNSVKSFYHDKKDGSHPLKGSKDEVDLFSRLTNVTFEPLSAIG